MRSSYLPSTNTINTGLKYGKLIAFVGLTLFVEAALAYPEVISSCVGVCEKMCNFYGPWEATNACTGIPSTKEGISLDLRQAPGNTRMVITSNEASPIGSFWVRDSKGIGCECVPTNNQPSATVNFRSK